MNTETITIDDVAKLDLRVATVVFVQPHPNADRLLLLDVDDASGSARRIVAGVREHVDPESLVGSQIVIVANLQPREVRGEMSHGMLLAAKDDNGVLGILTVRRPVLPGAKVG